MYHYTQGRVTKHAHKSIPDQHFEEEQGRGGFYGPASQLIKPAPSTRWQKITGPLKPHMFDLLKLDKSGKPAGLPLLHNTHMSLSFLRLPANESSIKQGQALKLYRNADADVLYFCHQGQGQVATEYGMLNFEAGEYVLMPKCVAHAFINQTYTSLLVIESRTSRFREPTRGLVGRTALYDINALQKPNLDALHTFKREHSLNFCHVVVKREGELTHFDYNACVLDAVGWKGDLWPFTLHTRELMPLMSSRVHLPPSAHTTFVAHDFIVCTFLPRPLEEDADALRVPFYHQNIDYDEVLFYHAGDFFSRDNLHAGMMSFHPAGFPHGPHPKAVQNVGAKTHTNECAVMIDARTKLNITPTLAAVELAEYWKSWQA